MRLRIIVVAIIVLANLAGIAAASPRWSAPERLYPRAGSQAVDPGIGDFGAVVADEAGRTAIAYYRDGTFRVRVGTVQGGFGPERNIGRYARAALAFGPDGRLVVALQRHVAAQRIADIVILERLAKGAWSAPESISEQGPVILAERPEIGIDGAGNVTVVWQQQGPGYDYQAFAAYRPAGGRFGPPVVISQPGPSVLRIFEPRIAVGADGTAVATWTRRLVAASGNAVSEVEVAVGRDGVWQPLAVLSPPGQYADAAAVAVGAHGEAVVSWSNTGASAGVQGRVQAAVRLGCDGFGPPADLSPVGEYTYLQAVGVDRLGDMLATWRRDEGTLSRVEAARRPAGATGWEPAQVLLAWPIQPRLSGVAPGLSVAPNGEAVVLALEPAGPGSVVRGRVGSVRNGRFGPTEEVLRGPAAMGNVSAVSAAIGLETPFATVEQVVDPLNVSYRRAGGAVRVSAQQLLVNQRIAQAAVRRANAIEAILDAGLSRDFIRNSSLEPTTFAPTVQFAPDASRGCIAPDPPAVVPIPAARSSSRQVTLSAKQLLINQRIAQAAVRRANALQARLDAGLTGGDVRDGAIDPAKIIPGMRIAAALPPPMAPAATITSPQRPSHTGAQVTLSAGQLLIGQRIAQAAVRRLNALADRLSSGLTSADFKPESLTASNLAPS